MKLSCTFRRLSLTAFIASATVLASCGDDPAAPIAGGGDPENVSRVTVSLTSAGMTPTTSFIVDADGTQGAGAPSAPQGTLTLTKGRTYAGTIQLLNDLDPNDVVDINGEISEEANFHRFFYTFSCDGVTVPTSGMSFDTQSPPQPVGLTFQVVVDASAPTSSACTLHVELHHFEGEKGDGLGSTFDTDLSVDFPVTVS